MLPDSDDPDRFVLGATFVTDRGRELVVRSVRAYRDRGLIIGFIGVETRPDAEALRGSVLTIDAEARRSLTAGEFWPEELEGLDAVALGGERLGRVERVEFGPGQDRLVIATPEGAEVLVPFVSAIVGDPRDGRIVIDAPEGLF